MRKYLFQHPLPYDKMIYIFITKFDDGEYTLKRVAEISLKDFPSYATPVSVLDSLEWQYETGVFAKSDIDITFSEDKKSFKKKKYDFTRIEKPKQSIKTII